jgi:hypothetical protein
VPTRHGGNFLLYRHIPLWYEAFVLCGPRPMSKPPHQRMKVLVSYKPPKAGTIQELQRNNLAVLIAASDVKRLSFAETVYTIERGALV